MPFQKNVLPHPLKLLFRNKFQVKLQIWTQSAKKATSLEVVYSFSLYFRSLIIVPYCVTISVLKLPQKQNLEKLLLVVDWEP